MTKKSPQKPRSKKPDFKWREVSIIPDREPKKCKHYFAFIGGECKCKGCGLGLIGVVDLKNGKPV